MRRGPMRAMAGVRGVARLRGGLPGVGHGGSEGRAGNRGREGEREEKAEAVHHEVHGTEGRIVYRASRRPRGTQDVGADAG